MTSVRRATLPTTAVALALVFAASASGAILFSTVEKGVSTGGQSNSAFLAHEAARLAPIANRLAPHQRERLARVDFRRYSVVAAFASVPESCFALDVAGIARKGRVLVTSGVVERREGICLAAVSTVYHVVKVRKAALGRPLPQRAVLKLAHWYRDR